MKANKGSANTGWAELKDLYRPGVIASLRTLAASLGLPAEGREYIRQALEAPSRRVRSTAGSASGSYPSQKMGVSIGFESRTLELPAILTLESDEGVAAYVDQAPALSVRYKRQGRTRAYQQRPDFLVLRRDGALLIECKPLEQILKRNVGDPGFYVQVDGRWTCPPLQEAARPLGLSHEVWTEASFSRIRLQNLRMLGDYLTGASKLPGYEQAVDAIQRYLGVKVRAGVEDLLRELREQITVDDLYLAIARGDVAFDLDAAPLSDPGRCTVFRDHQSMQAFELSGHSRVPLEQRISGAVVEISADVAIEWDGQLWRCVNIGRSTATIQQGDRYETLPRLVFDTLIREGRLKPTKTLEVASEDAHVRECIAKATPSDLRTANLRHARISRYLAPGARAPASRTERRYLSQYRQAQAKHGSGLIGLIPGFARCGNRTPRLLPDVMDIVIRVINEHYLTAANKHVLSVHRLILDECEAAHLPAPSYAWLCRFIHRMPAYQTQRSRKGAKGAYGIEARTQAHDQADKTSPERPWERGHLDHTLMDVETAFSETGEVLGRCWLTLLIDHDSRRVLAFHITYDAPSYRSVLMVFRKCVQRFGRLPEQVVVDGGKEFQSVWFDTTCALYRVTIIRRPVAKARHGSQGERFFDTCNTHLLHFLSGNTQLRKNVRQMTEEVNPSRFATWTLPDLHAHLEKYFYEVYDMLAHRELLVTPRLAYERGMERHGNRPDRLVVDNELFRITTSPSTEKGTAKVQPDGVKIRYVYYNHPALQRHLGKTLPVRYDPFDLAVAWAHVDGAWVELRSRHSQILRGFTEHQMDLMTAEWRKRRSAVEKAKLSEPVLVKFLKEVLQTETLLLERKRAAEERRLRAPDAHEHIDSVVEQECAGEAGLIPGAGAIDPFALAAANVELLETM